MNLEDMILINFPPCVIIIFLFIFLKYNARLAESIKKIFIIILLLEMLELVAYSTELYYASLEEPTYMRIFLSAIGYSLRPVFTYAVFKLSVRDKLSKKVEFLLRLPLYLNVLVAFSAFISKIAYYYDDNNVFHRGPLGFFTLFAIVLYLILLLFNLAFNKNKRSIFESLIIFACFLLIIISIAAENFFLVRSLGRTSIALTILFYYMYFQTQEYQDTLDEEDRIKHSLEIKSRVDGLTGLLNKSAFHDELASFDLSKNKLGLALIFFDLDHFKDINDYFGHLCGDNVLVKVSGILNGIFRKDDILSRFGGDEFCILIKEISYEETVEKIRILQNALRITQQDRKHTVNITGSIGVAYIKPGVNIDPNEIIDAADAAAYVAKNKGRDNSVVKIISK